MHFPHADSRQAYLLVTPARSPRLPKNSLDGVFTDPPYFDNVQYEELMDFCFVWLRRGLSGIFREFRRRTTRSDQELTGNVTRGRGLEHFTAGLSSIFCRFAKALKPQAAFVFTYHHNSPDVYVPIIIAILDSDLDCTATLPAAAEMNASLHIAGTDSSVLDTVFVCRKTRDVRRDDNLQALLTADQEAMRTAGVRITQGDLRCLASGHIARIAINRLHQSWRDRLPLRDKMSRVRDCVSKLSIDLGFEKIIKTILSEHPLRSKACKDPSK
jgi:adenine-specific DNA methylase